MPITINTNATAASANMHLSKNSEALRKSLPLDFQAGAELYNQSMTQAVLPYQ